jgi:hypothetical protein
MPWLRGSGAIGLHVHGRRINASAYGSGCGSFQFDGVAQRKCEVRGNRGRGIPGSVDDEGPMSAKRKVQVVVAEDPAGLDKVLLATGKGLSRFLESLIEKRIGRPVNIWDGKDGLGAVLEEQFKGMGIPNKRFFEVVTPRSVLEQSGFVKRKRAARRIKA